jgi:hypothetical protein
MSIGASACSLTVKRATREIIATGNNWFRQLLNLTVTGHSPTEPANLALFAYRGSTLVATGSAMVGTSSSGTGTMDTNTTELEAICDGKTFGSVRTLILRLWDAATAELIGSGPLVILCPSTDYADDSGADPVAPITPSTVKIGIFAFYNGLTYGLNSADSLYYRLTFDGAGELIHWHFEEAGISIP